MEWWHIGPLVLALLVFLLAGTVIEQHVESAVLRFVNHRQPQCQSLATVGVEACDGQELRQQQDAWLQQQLLKHKKELEEQELLLRKQQQEELKREEQMQQHTETVQEVKPSEKKSLSNTSVNRQLSASQAARKLVVDPSQVLQEPLLVQSLHQQAAQPIKQQSLQQLQSQQLKEQEPVQQSLQQQQSVQQQQQIQVQGLLVKQQSQQHSDIQPALPFVAVSEKSILQPTSKTTVGSKIMDIMQFNPKT
ncbi:bromodomain-containing protein DDB_G0280777-like [Cydia fagiglandana]|uniref:bromodomain-containing protein DDB_G0280777-like n=1 Tax=Cydia fagiglandana TaxID=1458189 RepID=UPI002FEE3D4F